MSQRKRNRLIHLKAASWAAFIVVAIALAALAGCNTNDSTITIPSSHYLDGKVAKGIEFSHSRCESCHDGLLAGFCMTGDDQLSTHGAAWTTFTAGGDLESDQMELLTENEDAMSLYFETSGKALNCQQCHETTLDKEGFLAQAFKGEATNSSEFCLDCHDVNKLIESTESWNGADGVNPHSSHVDEEEELACNSCHVFHSNTNVMYCNECHVYEVPKGWVSPPIVE